MKNILMDMDSTITETESAEEKVKLQSTQLYDIFSKEQTESSKAYSWNTWRVVVEILFDYVEKTEKGLKAVRDCWEKLWDIDIEEKKEESKVELVIPVGADEQRYKDEIIEILNGLDQRALRNAWLMLSAMSGKQN